MSKAGEDLNIVQSKSISTKRDQTSQEYETPLKVVEESKKLLTDRSEPIDRKIGEVNYPPKGTLGI